MKGYHNLRSTAKYFALIITAIIAATFIATVGFDAMHALPVQVSVILVILIDVSIAMGLWIVMAQILRRSVLKVANAIDKVSQGEEINIEENHDGTENIWNSLQKISERLSWYDGILDAVPFPIHVTDNNMKWTYMNKAFEQLMIDQGVVKHRKDGYGMACSNAGANICNTQNCGIKQLLKGKPESYFDWCGMNCKQDTAYLKNKKGESVGYVEVVSNLTSILRVNSYIKDSLDHLAGNLDLLSNGNLDIDLSVKDADEYTADARKHFVKISDHLSVLKDNLNALRKDITMLVSSATEGKLDVRADATQHHGCFSDLIKGVNQTLAVIEAPLTEAGKVLTKMSVNDYTTHMDGQYQGTFHEFAESINHVRERLLSVQDAIERIGKGDTERLDEFKKIGKRSENDKLIVSIISSMTSIRELINQADLLATASKNGKLDVRGDESKFEGAYREIIKGMNQTMEAFSTPIEEAASVMQELSEGNLTVSMNGDYKGDYNNIKQSLNTTIVSFDNILNDINSAATQVASGSNQVSNSAQALSQGSMEQASSIEELTASIEQIAAQTKQNAQNANEANEISLSAKQDAMRGNDQMSEMCRAMGDINESSTNISKIIKVIDDIAFQTNILALNAAVEAARAGQHGKGFAVVAEEVRTLAARSANAAKETTSLIEGSIERVQAGTKIANDTAQALTEIVGGVEKAAELVGNIAVASNEQALGIEQISQGITQVSKVTQMNSATSQESAAASEELFSQAEVLNSQVARFKLRKAAYTGVNTDTMPSNVNHVPKDANHSNEFHTGAVKHKPAVPKNIVLNDYGKY